MKKISAFILSAFACSVAFAQTGENKKSSFQVTFITPIGTNGKYSAEFTNDYSLNFFVGISKNEEQLTIGGLSNVILNDAKGVQAAGLFNYIGNSGEGLQGAGLANINKGRFCGLQVAGLFNIAADVKGVQAAGLFNFAKNVKGVQFAGLINIAENSDVPIGFINIIKNGEMGIALTYDGLGSTVASFRSGGKYTYGILGMGYNHKMKNCGLVLEAGLGAHIPVVKWFRINNEIKATVIGCNYDSNNAIYNAGYSLLPAFKLGRYFELFGGVSINYMESKNIDAVNILQTHSIWKGDNSIKLQQVYIGYQVGVQFML